MLRKIIIAFVSTSALVLGLVAGPAAADTDRALAAKASAVTAGSRVVVTISGPKPSKAALVVSGKRYPLKRKGPVWRTKSLSASVLNRFAGAKATVKVTVRGKKKTVKTTISGTTTTPPTGPGTGTTPLFAAPGVDREGDPAYQAVKEYFLNSTLTDCPAGWGVGCSVEQRYGIFGDGTQWYCRLTPNSGSDIRSVGTITQILYTAQKADGAWRVDYAMNSYGDTVYYSVNVAANGSAAVLYWGPGVNPGGPASDQTSGLTWMRGAKDCSY